VIGPFIGRDLHNFIQPFVDDTLHPFLLVIGEGVGFVKLEMIFFELAQLVSGLLEKGTGVARFVELFLDVHGAWYEDILFVEGPLEFDNASLEFVALFSQVFMTQKVIFFEFAQLAGSLLEKGPGVARFVELFLDIRGAW
jgi:hypothetical protein